MPAWIRRRRRWALYLRDQLRCVYCRVTVAELIDQDDGNFLTIDHLTPRHKHVDPHHATNLVTCCYVCNNLKGVKTRARFCQELGLNRGTVDSRVARQRAKPLEHYYAAADVLLGQLPGLPDQREADVVHNHDMLVRGQWSDDFDLQAWRHEKSQQHLFCRECGSVTPF